MIKRIITSILQGFGDLEQELASVFCKDKIVSILGLIGHAVSVTATW